MNSTAPFVPLSASNIVDNILLRKYSGNLDASIKTLLDPLPQTSYILQFEDSIDALIIHGFLMLGFLFIATSMIVIIIKERENNAKHQQMISGSGVLSYWMSNFFIDFAKLYLVCMIFYSLFYILDFQYYTKEDRGLMCFLLFTIYPINLVLQNYIFSYLFKSIGKG